MKKKIIPILLLIAIGGAIYHFKFRKESEPNPLASELQIYGTVDIRDVRLAFIEQERLAELLVEEGDRVKRGQVIGHQNTSRLQTTIKEVEARIGGQKALVDKLHAGNRPQEISRAEAEVAAAEVEEKNAGKLFARIQSTARSGATSKQELDNATASYSVATARLEVARKNLDLLNDGFRDEDIAAAELQLEALRATLELLHVRLTDRTLRAPADGIIQSRILEPGEMAGPTQPVANLALDHPKWVRAYLPEPFLGLVATGMQVDVISDTFPDTPVNGTVGFISPVAEFTPRTVQTEELRTKLVYETRIVVEDHQNTLRLGMPVTVKIDSGNTIVQ